jgi:ankyrin repeat protein
VKIASPLIVVSLFISMAVFADKDQATRLMLAAAHGDADAVGALLDQGVNVNVTDDGGYRALNYAVAKSQLKIVHLLLVKGADANLHPPDSFTPLIVAVGNDDLDTVVELLAHGAEVNQHDALLGETALMVASGDGRLEIVKALLAHGAKVNDKNKKGHTALDFATLKHQSEVITYLKKHGAT